MTFATKVQQFSISKLGLSGATFDVGDTLVPTTDIMLRSYLLALVAMHGEKFTTEAREAINLFLSDAPSNRILPGLVDLCNQFGIYPEETEQGPEHLGLALEGPRKTAISEMCSCTPPEFLPGAKELLRECGELELRVATYTSARERLEGPILSELLNRTGLGGVIPSSQRVWGTSDDVERRKPAPDGFLVAAARIGSKPDKMFAVGNAAGDVIGALDAGYQKAIGITGDDISGFRESLGDRASDERVVLLPSLEALKLVA